MVFGENSQMKLDEVDVFLAAQDGQIPRPRDPQRCRHNARQKCSYCLPIDPYDEEYLKEKEIKHMSFHSYCRKLLSGHGKGTHLKKPLENVNLKINLECAAHKPYPKGVCTKCRPPTVTLNRQKYRHVDNIQLENQEVVNEFLNYWRRTNSQRMGILIGKYTPTSDVPLGIRATVAAIYEPEQTGTHNNLKLPEAPSAMDAAVEKLCGWLQLRQVGWIFTDLWAANAAQLKHPNVTQYCSDATFGSKFVTVVASGDETEQVGLHGYQVSNQCEQLVDASLLCPTNHYELAFIRESPLSEQHYIPDVQYTEKNKYGAEVRRNGRPLPVEFLMVDVPTGVPKEPHHTFHVPAGAKFPVENRAAAGEAWENAKLTAYVEQFSLNQFLELATNFHFLLFLATQEIVPFKDEELASLCEAIRTANRAAAMEWAERTPAWAQLVALAHNGAPESASGSAGGSNGAATWSCSHCTFENEQGLADCQMCSLPKA